MGGDTVGRIQVYTQMESQQTAIAEERFYFAANQ